MKHLLSILVIVLPICRAIVVDVHNLQNNDIKRIDIQGCTAAPCIYKKGTTLDVLITLQASFDGAGDPRKKTSEIFVDLNIGEYRQSNGYAVSGVLTKDVVVNQTYTLSQPLSMATDKNYDEHNPEDPDAPQYGSPTGPRDVEITTWMLNYELIKTRVSLATFKVNIVD